MAYRAWWHPCCRHRNHLSDPRRSLCTRCGQPGIPDGWRFARGDDRVNFQRLFGVRPDGPHRGLAIRLLWPLTTACEGCDGRGLRGGHARWMPCLECRKLGRHWSADDAAIREAYRELFLLHPRCDAPGGRWRELLEIP